MNWSQMTWSEKLRYWWTRLRYGKTYTDIVTPAVGGKERSARSDEIRRQNIDVLNSLNPELGCVLCGRPLRNRRCLICQA